MRLLFTINIFFTLLLVADNINHDEDIEIDGKKVYQQKCASCHQLYISPSQLMENFMEQNNTILKLTAPTINQIVFRLKSRIGDPKGDEDMHRMEVESFVADYLMNPDKEKSVCLPKVLRHFETMPSMKGKISVDEIDAVSTFLYNYNPDDHVAKKLELVGYTKALEIAKKEDKIILLKLTREHCHFCKKMDREVFAESVVRDALNKNFKVVEIDIGKEGTLPLGLKKGMTPTFVFVNKEENIMAKIPGAWTKKDFLEILKEAVKAKGERE